MREELGPTSPAGRVAVSVELTLREGAARMWHCSRVGGPTGPPAALANEEGEADLSRRRARCGVTRRVRDSEEREPWGETLWDGPNQYFRGPDGGAWGDSMPLVAVTKNPGAIAYGSPWWLLDALCAVRDDATVVGRKRRRWWWKRFGPPHWMTTSNDLDQPAGVRPIALTADRRPRPSVDDGLDEGRSGRCGRHVVVGKPR
jgi:hypothetical protein